MAIISYAQNFEDVLLNRVFGGQETGFYIDVGAYDPVLGSVSKSLYDRGWSGINVEPGNIFEKLAAARPRDINLHMAVTDRAGEVGFLEDAADPGRSHIVFETPDVAATRTIRCDTLETIVRDYGQKRPIDFIKIDCEGAEVQIVKSTNWTEVRPRLLLIESTLPWSSMLSNQDWEPVLIEHGYVRAYFDGINCFYIPNEYADLLRHFQLPVNILDRFELYDPRRATAQAQLEASHTTNQALADDMARIGSERDTLHEQVVALQRELQTTQDRLETTRQRLYEAPAAQSAAVATVVEANAYQLADLRRRLAEAETFSASLAREHEAAFAKLRQERDALLGVRDQAAKLRRLLRELRWPDGPGALRVVLPLARLLRRVAGTKVPPVPPGEFALLAPETAGASGESAAGSTDASVPPRRSITKRALWVAYRPLRPVGRPAALRLRAFLTMHIHSEFKQLELKLGDLHGELARVASHQPMPVASAPDPRIAELHTDIRQFAKLLEDTLLTLAIDSVGSRPGERPGQRRNGSDKLTRYARSIRCDARSKTV